MTISDQTNRTSVVGDGTTQEIPFSFPASATSDIEVRSRVIDTGVESDPLTENSDYTVSLSGDSGGTVTMITTFASTYQIHVKRNTPMTQTLDLVPGGSFNAENIEDALDKSTKLSIQNSDQLDRTLKFPDTDPTSSFADMPNSIDRASKNLTFDSDGKPTASVVIEEGDVIFSDFGTSIAEATDADTARGLMELDTDDDVEFAEVKSTDVIAKSPWADIRAYGADTSNADNSTEIQAAFDSGKSVLIPEGTFIVLSQLTWTTDSATLQFVSHNSIIQAGATFPVDTPIIHFSNVHGCSIYNLHVQCLSRASGILLTDSGIISFYSPKIVSGRNGDDNYAFDIIASSQHSGTIWVYSMHIYGSDDSGGIRIQGDGYNVLDCGFQNIKIQHVRHGIYLKSDVYSCYFSNLMIDCTSTDAGTFAIKEEDDNNTQNIFHDVHCENSSVNGTGIDMQSTTSLSTMWDFWVDIFATKTVFADTIVQKQFFYIDGVVLRSRGRILVLHGAFDGYSPDATMTWGSVRSSAVANDDTWDKWDFALPLSSWSKIRTISNEFTTDDGSADLRMQVWKQSSELETWTQVGSDHDFTGDGPHTATIDYVIENNYVVKVSILAKRAAGTFLYIYPLVVIADY